MKRRIAVLRPHDGHTNILDSEQEGSVTVRVRYILYCSVSVYTTDAPRFGAGVVLRPGP